MGLRVEGSGGCSRDIVPRQLSIQSLRKVLVANFKGSVCVEGCLCVCVCICVCLCVCIWACVCLCVSGLVCVCVVQGTESPVYMTFGVLPCSALHHKSSTEDKMCPQTQRAKPGTELPVSMTQGFPGADSYS